MATNESSGPVVPLWLIQDCALMGAMDDDGDSLSSDEGGNDIFGDEMEALCGSQGGDEASGEGLDGLEPEENAVVVPITDDATAQPLIIKDNTDNTTDKGPLFLGKRKETCVGKTFEVLS